MHSENLYLQAKAQRSDPVLVASVSVLIIFLSLILPVSIIENSGTFQTSTKLTVYFLLVLSSLSITFGTRNMTGNFLVNLDRGRAYCEFFKDRRVKDNLLILLINSIFICIYL